MCKTSRLDRIERLRERISHIETASPSDRSMVAPLGCAEVDRHLPAGGLPLAAMHEIEGARAEWDDGVATAFCLVLLRALFRRHGFGGAGGGTAVLWISPLGDLHVPALLDFGLDPSRFVFVRPRGERETLWAMEEALRSATLIAVVGEAEGPDMRAARRLQLAAEKSGTAALLLLRGLGSRRGAPSGAFSRWRISARSSPGESRGSEGGGAAPPWLGPSSWQVDLLRCRQARQMSWIFEWERSDDAPWDRHATDDFALAATVCHRPQDLPAASGLRQSRRAG